MADRQDGGIQSVSRAIEVLECLADAGGVMGLSQMAAATSLPLPTIHRIMRALISNGYVRQQPSRRYALGARLIRLGDVANRTMGVWAVPHLAALVDEIGETANMAMLDGDAAVYVAQAPSEHSLRMFTEVGRRVMVHCTGVGKVLLSQLGDDEVHQILRRTGLPPQTEYTITTANRLVAELHRIRERGYGIDLGEQEIGVCCVAVPVYGVPGHLAISVSGPAGRLTDQRVPQIVPALQRVAKELGNDLFREMSAPLA